MVNVPVSTFANNSFPSSMRDMPEIRTYTAVANELGVCSRIWMPQDQTLRDKGIWARGM